MNSLYTFKDLQKVKKRLIDELRQLSYYDLTLACYTSVVVFLLLFWLLLLLLLMLHLQSASLTFTLPWLMVALWIWTCYSSDGSSQRSLSITGKRWSLMIQHLAQITIETHSKSLLCKIHLNTTLLMYLLIVAETSWFFYFFSLHFFCQNFSDWKHLRGGSCHIIDV